VQARKKEIMTDVRVWVQNTRDYVGELKAEMRRVTWPSRKQVEGTTAVVIISVFLFAGYFAVIDRILATGINKLLGYFSK
jgi:preprotein translocase subunit SecE